MNIGLVRIKDRAASLTLFSLAVATFCVSLACLFTPNCSIPVKLVCVLTFVLAWLILGLHSSSKEWDSAVVCLLTAIGGVLFACGVAYLIAAHISNLKTSPSCSPLWARIFFWLGMLSTLVAYFMPFSRRVVSDVSEYLQVREVKSIEEHCQSATVALYSRDVRLAKEVSQDSQSRNLIKHLQENPLSLEELEKVFEFIGHVRGPALTDSPIVCCKCKEAVQTDCRYVILPDCYHDYDFDCFKKHCSEGEVTCAVCETHIRRAVLYKIHRFLPNINGELF